jgi:hypothetical protein
MREHGRRSIAGGLIAVTAAVPVATPGRDQGSPDDRRPVVVEVRDHGFDWADAAIGAAGALGLVLTVGGVAVLVRPSRPGSSRRKGHA